MAEVYGVSDCLGQHKWVTLSKPDNSVAQGERIQGRMRILPHCERIEGSASPIAFGNQTISRNVEGIVKKTRTLEIHGFASLLHSRFAFIVCNHRVKRSSLSSEPIAFDFD